jgi:hypothetical protein
MLSLLDWGHKDKLMFMLVFTGILTRNPLWLNDGLALTCIFFLLVDIGVLV